jgi:hypothetical protein
VQAAEQVTGRLATLKQQSMTIRAKLDDDKFNERAALPFELRLSDFKAAMQDVYDYFFDVNSMFLGRGLPRLEETLRAANMSGMLSDMLTASLAKHSRALCQNEQHNGHPDLVVRGVYPKNCVKAGDQGVEIKSTRKAGGAVDTHGGRDQWMCVFVYDVDSTTEPAKSRKPTRFTEVYINKVEAAEFRRNLRGELGTPTSTLGRTGIGRLRSNWVYKL